MARPARADKRDSRAAILKAARVEFAARGFAGAGVDRLARRARVNKAMLYYHFGSKLGLYRAVLAEGFEALTVEVAGAVADHPPGFPQLESYLHTLLRSVSRRPHVVPIMLREIAEGGRNLDAACMRRMIAIFRVMHGVLASGEQAGAFRHLHPLMTHFVILGSAMLYTANEPIRLRIRQLKIPGGPRDVPVGSEPFVRYMNHLLRHALGAAPGESTHA
jgi:TetR/AcrR family transcriptional regulator